MAKSSSKRNHLELIARVAMRSGREVLPAYSHPKSPQKFTQAQLLACLVLRAYLKSTYRGVVEILEVSPPLRRALHLTNEVPHYSTLKYFADRLGEDPQVFNRLLADVVRLAGGTSGQEGAMDSTGLETTSASAYYQARSGKSKFHYVKCSVLVLCGSLLAFGLVVGWGPNNDKCQVRDLIAVGQQHPPLKALYADAGYDAEYVHQLCRDDWGTPSYIPLVWRRADGTVGGRWRAEMTELPKSYGRRWHVETFMSGLKRLTLSHLRARLQAALFTEAAIRILAYTIHR